MIVSNSIKISQLTLNTDDSEQFPMAQVTYLGKVCNVVMVNPYGLIGRAPAKDSLAVLFNQQGHESARLGIMTCPQKRKKGLKDGESGIENVLTGNYVFLKENGDTEIFTKKDLIAAITENIIATFKVMNLTGTTINIAADVNLTGKLYTTGELKNNSKFVGSTHVHSGVQSGGSNTNVPV